MKNSNCGILKLNYLNKLICIFGWVNRIRNYGNILFIDIRDKTGVIQIVLKNVNKKKFLNFLKLESCVYVKGYLTKRDIFFYNFFLKTGEIELYCYNFFIINKSKDIIFDLNNYYLSDFIKLNNRFLNLRSSLMQNNLFIRYNFIKYLRNFLNKEFFIDIETPYLTRNTPEGAKDFLVFYRFDELKFFALPQSPQIFKQILMISNFDKYYQIVRCFRDEDYRKNRQSEFTQLDFELSFYKIYDIIYFFSNLIIFIFKTFINYNLFVFFFINYINSKKFFLSDKPELRIKLNYYNFFFFLKLKFFIFNFSFKFIVLNLLNFYNLFGNNFKNFIFFINKNFFFINILIIIKKKKYLIFFILNILKKKIFLNYFFEFNIIFNNIYINSGLIIINLKEKLINFFFIYLYKLCFSIFGIFNKFLNYYFFPIWVFNFPLFELNSELNYNYIHNPFSTPLNFDKIYLDFFVTKCNSKSYDIIINGNEIGGGSIRNEKIYIQKRIFFILRFNLSFFINCLNFGTPIHGGIAIGIERFLISFLFNNSIKDVIAFPKTQKGFCLLTNSPNFLN